MDLDHSDVGKIMNKLLSKGMLVLCAFIPLFIAHSYVFQSHLRHGIVEDGSVSQYAGELLDDRTILEKYKAVLDCDGKANGRYRPGYYVYETIPFFLTLIKNGDYEFGMPRNKIRGRINGDVQFHMIYLLLTIGISIFFGSIIIHKLTGSFLYAALFPLAVVFSAPLVWNITYNDTAEVPQLLVFSCYIVFFLFGEGAIRQRKKTGWLYLLVSIPLAIFLYLIKETAVVLLPAIFLYFLYFFIIRWKEERQQSEIWKNNLLFLLSHLLINCVLTIWVLLQVKSLKGGYSSHYELKSFQQLWDAFVSYGKMLISFPPSVYIPLLSFAIVVLVTLWLRKSVIEHGLDNHYILGVSFLLIFIAFGFLVLNLPWEFILQRYMLPTAFFSALAGGLLVGYLDSLFGSLSRWPRYTGKIVMLVLVVIWSYPAASRETSHIEGSYLVEYGVHRIINRLTDDIIDEAKNNDSNQYKVLLDTGNMSHWMWIQAARIINREGRLNVVVPGQKYPIERLYLRHYDNAPEVTLVATDGDGYSSMPFDVIYSSFSLSHPSRNKDKSTRLEKLNDQYLKADEWEVFGNPYEKFMLIKYITHGEG
jgi:hypothetical protein